MASRPSAAAVVRASALWFKARRFYRWRIHPCEESVSVESSLGIFLSLSEGFGYPLGRQTANTRRWITQNDFLTADG